MEVKSTFAVSKEDGDALQHLADLLHLFHHRNKNQHRRSTWWRNFQVFRKQLNSMAAEINGLKAVPTTHLARTKKKTQDQQILQRIEGRLSFWQDIMVPKWQHAFSQLSADGRFAVLGLVLLASLAETCRIFGVTAAFEDLGQAEVEKVLEQFAKEDWEHYGDPGDGASGDHEDVGEVISRELPTAQVDATERAAMIKPTKAVTTLPQAELETSKPADKRTADGTGIAIKKKRRKGNAIDDLFSGLG
ncbi:hypothetical protein LTR36_009356 [Oleoguttula mirabilis]|uniref:RNase MRP protein 1 RNA binding domain-containing protein n=1 Tax=Oleoguttula mirabilis TaxID=1507867 RepID=A0AAV9JTV4_9PEZI|nr:hypothetical protein LTR36_009356 [Oleoguttula mirabilis]